MLVVESDLACFDTIYREVQVHTDVIVYAPNTFTPDGDDLNQYWRVYIDGIDTYDFELIVYNRWGQKVWENRDPNDGWDGSYNGHFVEDGTYLWIIHTKDFLTDEHYKFTGHLNIIR
ncbi:gliding motility-associated C-terminal domain-containing protein [Crocinitomicaceae bacterium]|nr:gliding motility-associated C-terminal domain-containing protein [Crocinitomicaceae bacterium]